MTTGLRFCVRLGACRLLLVCKFGVETRLCCVTERVLERSGANLVMDELPDRYTRVGVDEEGRFCVRVLSIT